MQERPVKDDAATARRANELAGKTATATGSTSGIAQAPVIFERQGVPR
jgi:hypothetical protein